MMQTIPLRDWRDFDWDRAAMLFPMLVMYRHPKDQPDKYVVRLFDMDEPTPYAVLSDSEDEAIAAIPRTFVRLNRSPDDEPQIVCTYV